MPILFVLVEGDDDERFFDKIAKPLLEKRYSVVKFYKYAQRSPKDTTKMIKSAKSMGDYMYVRDLNNSPCISLKKERIKEELSQRIEDKKIVIVVREIESWYLAGMNEQAFKYLGIRKAVKNTEITKERFDQLIPKGMVRKEFMYRILEKFEIEMARIQNSSFRYFLNKWIDFQQTIYFKLAANDSEE